MSRHPTASRLAALTLAVSLLTLGTASQAQLLGGSSVLRGHSGGGLSGGFGPRGLGLEGQARGAIRADREAAEMPRDTAQPVGGATSGAGRSVKDRAEALSARGTSTLQGGAARATELREGATERAEGAREGAASRAAELREGVAGRTEGLRERAAGRAGTVKDDAGEAIAAGVERGRGAAGPIGSAGQASGSTAGEGQATVAPRPAESATSSGAEPKGKPALGLSTQGSGSAEGDASGRRVDASGQGSASAGVRR